MVEVLAVIGILLTVAAIVWLLVMPGIRLRSFEGVVRADLRQIVVAINLYLQDNDDAYPPGLAYLPKDVPRKFSGTRMKSNHDWWMGSGPYTYNRGRGWAAGVENMDAIVQWNPNEWSLVDAPFLVGATKKVLRSWPQTDGSIGPPSRGVASIVLGAWQDGRIRWKEFPDLWQHFAMAPRPKSQGSGGQR